MCGIAGTMERDVRSAAALEETARLMAAPLVHRGPDADGTWADADAGVGFGHRRLSIVELSPAGEQPMVSASGRFVISYNGEVYNTDELRPELEAHGIRFRGRSDTEVLLEACAEWGVAAAMKRVIGMFAFALWDREERCLYLVRDRIGIKPLYYFATPERFTFASELTGLLAHPSFEPTVDTDAEDAFLAFDFIPAPWSIFRGVKKLEPGTVLRVKFGALDVARIEPYWTLEEAARMGAEDRFAGTLEEAADELEWLLSDAVRRRMLADVPLGAFLSGGVDSSTVVALMQKFSSQPVKTFTIGFREGAFDEAPYARAIAAHLGTDHHEHYVTDDEIRELGPAIMAQHDEPFADPSLLPTQFLSRLARSEVTVALSGDGGDELFGGYSRYRSAERMFSHPALNWGPLGKALFRTVGPKLPWGLLTGVQRLPGIAAKLGRPLSPQKMRLLASGIHNPRYFHHCLTHGGIRLVRGKVNGPKLAVDRIDNLLDQCRTGTLSPAERQQYLDTLCYLPDNILTKVDRASMAVSLEVRVPMLDHRIVEFSFRLPPSMKANGCQTKRLLRMILGRHVPEPMFERAKQGFRGPIRSWRRGPLSTWATEMTSRTRHRNSAIRPIQRRHGFSGYKDSEPAQSDSNVPRSRTRRGMRIRPSFKRLALEAWYDAR